MLHRRELLRLGLAGLTAAALGGCASSGNGTQGAGSGVLTASPKGDGPVNVALLTSGLEGPRVALQIEQALQDLHIRGEASNLGHILISADSGQGPGALADAIEQAAKEKRQLDIIFLSHDEEADVLDSRGLLVPVQEVAKTDPGFDPGSYFPAALKTVETEGRMMGLPLWFKPTVLRYSPQALEAAGVSPPDSGWDWSTFLESARRLTKSGSAGSQAQYGFVVSPYLTPSFTFIWQNGGDVVSKDGRTATVSSPEAVEAIRFIKSLVVDYAVAPRLGAGENLESLTPSFRPGGPPTVGGVPVAMAPMAYGSSFGMQVNTTRSQRGGNVEVTVDIVVKADQKGSIIVGGGAGSTVGVALPKGKVEANLASPGGMLALLSTSPDPGAAWRALRALGGALQSRGSVPAKRVGPVELMAIDPLLTQLEAESMAKAANSARTPQFPHRHEVVTILREVVDAPVLRGAADPEKVLEDAAKQIDKLLAG